ncbi:SCAN domain-containing protein [Tanacetum coccineum]
MATCHHLSGATWHFHCSPPPVNRRRTTGQRWSTTERSTWSTTVNKIPPTTDHGGVNDWTSGCDRPLPTTVTTVNHRQRCRPPVRPAWIGSSSPKGTIFLASIDTSDISKTKENVFAMLDDFIKKIGEEHVVQVVTDNAANYKAAEDFEKKIEEHKVTIAKGRKVVSFIYNRTHLICLLKEFSNGKELLRPGATRFATLYLTLCRLYELKGKNIESIVLDNVRFWRSVNTCYTAVIALIKVLRMVDSDSPAMGFVLDAMVNAKKEIKFMYKDVQLRYQPILDIIDQRWENQLQRPLHVAALDMSFISCERIGVLLEMVHSKRRNRLQQHKMNDLVYVMYNLKLSGREERKQKEEDFETFHFEDVDSDDEWITEDVVLGIY